LNDKRNQIVKEALDCRLQLIAYARSFVRDYSTAEDIVQQGYLVICDKFDQFEEGTSMLAWCRAIIRIEVLRFRDHQRRDRTLADRLLDDALDAAYDQFQVQRRRRNNEDWQEAILQCLGRISENGRKVIRARFVEGLSYSQIAARLGMTIEAIRKSLFRNKRKLRACVESRQRQEL